MKKSMLSVVARSVACIAGEVYLAQAAISRKLTQSASESLTRLYAVKVIGVSEHIADVLQAETRRATEALSVVHEETVRSIVQGRVGIHEGLVEGWRSAQVALHVQRDTILMELAYEATAQAAEAGRNRRVSSQAN